MASFSNASSPHAQLSSLLLLPSTPQNLLLADSLLSSLAADPYLALLLPPSCSPGDVARGYRKLALRYHPDKSPATAPIFREVCAAYELLADPERRGEHDREREKPKGAKRSEEWWAARSAPRKKEAAGGPATLHHDGGDGPASRNDGRRGGVTEATFEPGITRVGANAFLYCSSLTEVVVPDTVTSIGANAFKGCSSLVSLSLPPSLTSLGSYCFNGCSSLASLSLPPSLLSVGGWAFSYCSSLARLDVPPALEKVGHAPFTGCKALVPKGRVNVTDTEAVLKYLREKWADPSVDAENVDPGINSAG